MLFWFEGRVTGRILLTLLFSLGLGLGATAQSNSKAHVRGKVVDEQGEPIIGAVVSVREDLKLAVPTNLDGDFDLAVPAGKPYTLFVRFLGYAEVEFSVPALAEGASIQQSFFLKPANKVIKEVVIQSKANKARDAYLDKMKTNAAVSIDFISNEGMKRVGDSHVASAVARVSGVSTNGGFITVRGIGDRYVRTTINGLRIPTLDPFTNNLRLDLFPSSLIDHVVLTKTMEPELPGDWAGAYLSIQTKEFPEALAITTETTIGYNAQSTLTPVLSSQRSSTDWLGFDQGLRNYDHEAFREVNIKPTPYQQFAGLGMEGYFNSFGVNSQTPWRDTYYKLGLVKLGLLAPAQMDNQLAFLQAKNQFNQQGFAEKAFREINAEAVQRNGAFANNWQSTQRTPFLNLSQSFSIGNRISVAGRPLGFLFGFRYGSTSLNDPKSTASRAYVDATGTPGVSSMAEQAFSREVNGWNALASLHYAYHPNHQISILYMPNQMGTNNVRKYQDDADNEFVRYGIDQFYEQRSQQVGQLKSSHFFKRSALKVELASSFTFGKSEAPDFKNLQYLLNKGTGNFQIAGALGVNRFFRYLNENMWDTRIDLEKSIPITLERSLKVKFGGAYQLLDRASKQYNYSMNFSPRADLNLPNGDLEAFFQPSRLDFSTGYFNGEKYVTVYQFYQEDGLPSNYTIGRSNIQAYYVQTDLALPFHLRLVAGVRAEYAQLFTDVFRSDSLGYKANDPRRLYVGDLFLVNPGELKTLNFLPSANLIWKFKDGEEESGNLRASYSQSLARPSLRELSETVVYDYELRANVFGNSALVPVSIQNFDLRLERTFPNGNQFSISGFYKDFRNHIEMVQSVQGYSWQNVDKSFVQGVELEGRVQLMKGLEARANFTWVKSQTTFVQTNLLIERGQKTYVPIDTVQRTMFGQAPYVLNALLNYAHDSLGLSASVAYNVQGPRLVLVSTNGAPNIFEVPRHLIDLRISKKLGKHWTVSLLAKDVLNSPIRRAYKYPEGYTLSYDVFRFGTTYQLTVAYRL